MLPLKNARFLKKGQLIDCMPNMELLKLGDAREFKKLFELHAPRLLNTALYLLGNRQDAEDVTQEVFKSVYIGLPQFKEESSVHTWMHRITLNKCNEFFKNTSSVISYRSLQASKYFLIFSEGSLKKASALSTNSS